jgi:predicted component of type VI protein secretion system
MPFGTDGPWLAAILDVLNDLHDLIEARLPAAQGGEPSPVAEPAPEATPANAVPVAEPAPARAPETPDGDNDEDEQPEPTPVEITEPAPADPPAPQPDSPPTRGKGSGLEAWQAYATAVGVSYPADATRNDIIAACREAGVLNAS